MASQQTLNALATHIRLGVEASGSVPCVERDLALLWENQNISSIEKSLLIKNFATAYGFKVNVDVNKMSATFMFRTLLDIARIPGNKRIPLGSTLVPR